MFSIIMKYYFFIMVKKFEYFAGIFYGEKKTMKSPTDKDQEKENIPIENKTLDIPIGVNTSISNSVG